MYIHRLVRIAILLSLTAFLGACVQLATHRMAHSVSQSILNQDDPETVRDGAPAYLLLIDGLIRGASALPRFADRGCRMRRAREIWRT